MVLVRSARNSHLLHVCEICPSIGTKRSRSWESSQVKSPREDRPPSSKRLTCTRRQVVDCRTALWTAQTSAGAYCLPI